MNILDNLGIKQKKKQVTYEELVFYFMHEFHVNPLPEEYIIKGNRIIKKGIELPIFLSLLEELKKHNEREQMERKKANRRGFR